MAAGDSDDDEQRMQFTRRSLVLGGVQAAGFGVLGWRLFNLQVVDQGRYAPLAESNRINLQILAPKRGRILDVRGTVLADNEEVFRVSIVPAFAGDVTSVLSMLRRIVPITSDDIEKIARRSKKQSRHLAIVIANDLTFDQVAKINVFQPHLPGIRTEVAWRRRYQQGPAVGHIVGYTGGIERLGVDDDAVKRLPGARIGKGGVEAGMEVALRGKGGAQKIEVDARGHLVRNLETIDAVPGQDLSLTIDTELQRKVVERLQQERRASCVGINIQTGAVVVMASTPGYDPAELADGITGGAWQRLAASQEKPMINRAISGQYPPGSTFKMVTALAGLQANHISPSDHITCGGSFGYGKRSFRCWKRSGHGAMALHDALRESCDVYFYELARRIGIETLSDVARLCGLGVTHSCGLVDAKPGLVPDPDWKRGRRNAGWLGGETVLTGIGQGYMLTTPLQLAVMTARIASGKAVVPTLIKPTPGSAETYFADLGFNPSHLDVIRRGLVAVVNESGGTGGRASLGEGAPIVAGKTGTSQVSRASSDTSTENLPWHQRDHALFVSYVPAGSPRYAFAAVIEHGGGGGANAAPLVKDVMSLVLAHEGIFSSGTSGRNLDREG
jgi:penicillin-binding protein 2